jgi:hypothetical protein
MLLPRHFHPKKYIKTEHYYLVIMISFPDLMISKKYLMPIEGISEYQIATSDSQMTEQ